jgi:hypothetical protein
VHDHFDADAISQQNVRIQQGVLKVTIPTAQIYGVGIQKRNDRGAGID